MGAEKDGQGVSPELDDLSSTLMGQAFDVLAEGVELDVILAVEDAAGHVASYTFADDGPEEYRALHLPGLLPGCRQRAAHH